MKALGGGVVLLLLGLAGLTQVDARAENLFAVLSPAAIVAAYCLIGYGLAGGPDGDEGAGERGAKEA